MNLILRKKINNIFKSGKRSFIVAELSANHNKKISNIIKIINNSKKIGLDAIKVQMYKPEEITLNSSRKDFRVQKGNTWSNYQTLFNLYTKGSMPFEWYKKLAKICKKKKIIFFSSVFDLNTVDFLEKNNCPIYKIASPEITDIPLLQKVAKTKKPVFISTGLAKKKDIELALKTLKKNNCKKIVLMKCTSAYPAPRNEINLNTMLDFKKKFNVTIGYSDHTKNNVAGIASAVLGARVIEKHIMLNKKMNTLDSFFSQDLLQFKHFVEQIREAEDCLGTINYNISESSKKNMLGRKSLYAIKDINKNEVFTYENVKSIRPSLGLHPKYLEKILNKKSRLNFKYGDRLTLKGLK